MRRTPSTAFLLVGALAAAAASAQQWHRTPDVANNVWWGNTLSQVLDFDQSGKPDILIPTGLGQVRVIWDVDMTSTSFTYSTLWAQAPGATYALLHAGDVNGDAIPDLVAWGPGFTPPRNIHIVAGTGGGQLATPAAISPSLPVAPSLVRILDVDGDGDRDMLAVTHNATANNVYDVRVWTQDASGWTLVHNETLGLSVWPVGIGDFNGDGCDDAIFYFGYPLYQHRILWGDPQSLSATVTIPFLGPFRTDFHSGGDFNGDGRDDIVAAGSQGTLEVYFGASNGIIAGPVLGSGQSSDLYRPTIADIDGDQRLDIIAVRSVVTEVFRGDGLGGFSPSPQAMPSFKQLLDLDGDSDLDTLNAAGHNPGDPVVRFENRAIYGSPCLGTNGEPRLDIGAATPGNAAFTLGISNAPPGALAQLVIALDGSPGPCGPQFDPASVLLPAFGSPLFGLTIGANGSVQVPLPLPVGLPQIPFYLQGIVVDANGAVQLPGLSLSATRGRVIELF